MSTDGHPLGFFVTIRPRNGVTDEQLRRLERWLPQFATYYFVAVEKEGTERHAHCVVCPRKNQQRSNAITMFINNVVHDFDVEELANFRRYDKVKKTGAFLHFYALYLITDYLDGTRESKSADPYRVLCQQLPDDLDDLSGYIPAVGQLERGKNLRFHTFHRQLTSNFGWPKQKEGKVTQAYVLACLHKLEHQDIRDSMLDERLKRNFINGFVRWWNRYEAGCYESGPTDDTRFAGANCHFEHLMFENSNS